MADYTEQNNAGGTSEYTKTADGIVKINKDANGNQVSATLIRSGDSRMQYIPSEVGGSRASTTNAGSTIVRAGAGTTDASEYLNDYYNSMEKARLAQLSAAKTKALQELNTQKSGIAPQYNTLRNQTDANMYQGAQRLREAMANQGLSRSGENVTGQIALQSARNASLGNLDLQQQNAYNDINNQISNVKTAYDSQSVLNELEAARAQALATQYNTDRNYRYNASQDAFNNALAAAQVKGTYNGAPTYQAQQDSKQQALSSALAEVQTFGEVKTQAAAAALGVPIGTKSYEAQAAYQQQQNALALIRARATTTKKTPTTSNADDVDSWE